MGLLTDVLSVLLFVTYDRKGGPGEFRVMNDPIQVQRNEVLTGDYVVNNIYDINNAIRFRLWTRENPILAQEIVVHDRTSYQTSNYDPKRLTKIFVHGKDHTSNERRLDPETAYLRDAYLRFADVNFILVDWTHLAFGQRYFTNYGDFVAKRLAQFIRYLERLGTPISSFHLLGLSWGAHVCGGAGSLLGGRIPRITGLDPAGPLYTGRPSEYSLDKSDAQFVDIIHTDSGGARGAHSGNPGLLGHADFYPNGGKHQTGCPPINPKFFKEIPCSHERSVPLFTESIGSPLSFPSCPAPYEKDHVQVVSNCTTDKMAFMGEHVANTTRGTFYLATKGAAPYGTGPLMDIILPNIPGGRRGRSHIFSLREFRFMKTYNVKAYRESLGNSNAKFVSQTETLFSPSNNTNTLFYSSPKPYMPGYYPNRDVILFALEKAVQSS